MNKNLISQNPIQRFKLGKQIQKFDDGGYFLNGQRLQTNKGKKVLIDGKWIDPKVAKNVEYIRFGKPNTGTGEVFDPMSITKKKGNITVPLKPGVKAEEIVQKNSNVSNSSNVKPASKVVNVNKPSINYGERFNNFVNGLTNEQKLFLQDEGITDLEY